MPFDPPVPGWKTLLEKLDQAVEALGNIDIDADTINLNTDGIEGKQDEQISQLTDIINQLQTILTDIDEINGKVATASNQDAANLYLDAIDDKLADIETNQTNGDQKVQLVDDFGFKAQFNPMRSLRAIEPVRMIGGHFTDALDTNFWTAANSGTGSAAGAANGISTMTSGTDNGGYGQIQSVRRARFTFANPLLFRTAVRLPVVNVTGNKRRWGSFTTTATTTPSNGVYFEVSDGILSINHVSGGSVTPKVSGSFNGAVSSYTVDTNVHAYEIMYFVMGAWVYIDDVLIHKFIPTTAMLYESVEHNITITSINTSTNSGTLECWGSTIIKQGQLKTNPNYYNTATAVTVTLRRGAGMLHGITINDPGGATDSITLYDSLTGSGTQMSSIAIGKTTQPTTLTYNDGIPFNIGLTMVTVGTTNITIIFE